MPINEKVNKSNLYTSSVTNKIFRITVRQEIRTHLCSLSLLLVIFLIPCNHSAHDHVLPIIAEYIDPNEFACNSVELLPNLAKMVAVSRHTKIDSKMLTADAKVSIKVHRSGA